MTASGGRLGAFPDSLARRLAYSPREGSPAARSASVLLHRPRFPAERDPHLATRTLACLAAALALALGAVTFWPARTAAAPPEVFSTERERVDPIEVVEIPQTRPPPPPPNLVPPPPPISELDLPPVEVDDLVEIEDIVVDRFDVDVEPPTPAAPGPPAPIAPPGPPAPAPGPRRPAAPSGPALVRAPDTLPVNRFVPFPVYPDAARREGVEGRATVRILVSEGGRVAEFEVLERVVTRRGREERVERLPYGMEESVTDAVRRLVYSPARHDGRIVRTYTRETLRVGVE